MTEPVDWPIPPLYKGKVEIPHPVDKPPCQQCEAAFGECKCLNNEPNDPVPDVILTGYEFVNWVDAFTDQPEEVEWLIEPFLEAGTLNALYATPGHGKSLITLEIAAGFARGGEHVLYLDNENRIRDHVERLQDMGYKPDMLSNLHMLSFQALPALDTFEGGRVILALAKKVSARLVIIDTTGRFVHGKENDADTFNAMYNRTLIPLKGAGITVLRLDHPGKDLDKGERGSSAKQGDVDTRWELVKTGTPLDDSPRVLTCQKSRNAHAPQSIRLDIIREPIFCHNWVWNLSPDLSPDGSARGQEKLSPDLSLVRALDDMLVPLNEGREKVRKRLQKAGIPARNDQLSRAIQYRRDYAARAVQDALSDQ